jgi:alpha/beta superfamily hydrolase
VSVEIRSNTVLPARCEPLTLVTDDGLRLVGELALPESNPPRATLVTLHPLPTHGGMMDSHLIRKAAWRLPALADIGVLRFNTRGTTSPAGTSEGRFDEGRGELHDVTAALEFVRSRGLGNVWVLGWSFGTDLALRHGPEPDVVGTILLSPPLRQATDEDLDRWAASGARLTALVPELDDYLQPPQARERFARVPQAEVVGIDGVRHLWVGEKAVTRALSEVVARVVPDRVPLPLTWPPTPS